jgi:type IV secretory pathway ATPase VirB11/archaellum biosynthesis ATPase
MLLQTALTINPDYIAVAEMKGEESFEAVAAANIANRHRGFCAV